MAKPNAAPEAGMAKPELRKHIVMARRKPLHIAFALGGDGRAIVVMDPRKAPRAIEKQIKDQASDSKNHRFGLVRFDVDEPSIARIVVNKPSAGMAKKLILALKGTGVRQIELVMEDGTSVESAQSEDDEDAGDSPDQNADAGQDETETNAPVTPDATTAAAAPSDDDAGGQTKLDTTSLTRDLSQLVKRMIGVIGKDPSQKAALVELATDAQASLKRGDLPQAEAGIAVFKQALDTLGEQALDTVGEQALDTVGEQADGDTTTPDPAKAPKPAATHGNVAVQRYRKSRLVWVATRAKVDADLQKLSTAIAAFDTGGQFGDDIASTFLKTVDPVLSTLDDSLAGLLAQAEQAKDQNEAEEALDQARTTIGLYRDFAASNPLIKQVDANPFMPMAIGKTISASLAALAASIH